MYVQYTFVCNPFVAFASKVDCSQQSENTLFSIDVGKILCTLPSLFYSNILNNKKKHTYFLLHTFTPQKSRPCGFGQSLG